MEVQEAFKASRSVSKFKPSPVPESAVQKLASAARLAPSVEDIQPWKVVVVNDEDLKRKLAGACSNGKILADAPMVLVACARLDEAVATVGGYMNAYPVDVGMAMSYMTLAAINEGLGTCWLFSFNEEKVRKALDIPEDTAKVVAITPLGVPADWHEHSRRHASELLAFNAYE